jgi:hypothetical protein
MGMSSGRRWLASALLMALAACNVVPQVPGGTGFLYDAALLPATRSLGVGETGTYTYTVYDSQNNRYLTDFGPVSWSNETPAVLGLVPAGGDCGSRGDRCVAVTGVAAGVGQIRAFAIVNGAHVDAAASFSVR